MIHRIAVAQAHPRIGDVPVNVATIESMARRARDQGARMVVFPELMTTGYAFRDYAELAETLSLGTGTDRIAQLSAELGIVLVVGYSEVHDGLAYNESGLWENGELLADYAKTHLWNTEKEIFTPGDALPPVVETEVGRVSLAVCYDLEFPELLRHCASNSADIVAAPTNWPSGFEAPTHRGEFNGELLRAMAGASANRMYLAIACRTGEERGVDWVDNSCVVNPDGYPITNFIDGAGIIVSDIDLGQSRMKSISPLNDVLKDRRLDLY